MIPISVLIVRNGVFTSSGTVARIGTCLVLAKSGFSRAFSARSIKNAHSLALQVADLATKEARGKGFQAPPIKLRLPPTNRRSSRSGTMPHAKVPPRFLRSCVMSSRLTAPATLSVSSRLNRT
jgi:hypothetical protein